jgi:hypothetical protein
MQHFNKAAQSQWQNDVCIKIATTENPRCVRKATASKAVAAVAVWAGLLGASSAAHAAQSDPASDYIADLAACQALTEDSARLSCYDEKVAAMVTARDAGAVQLVDREVVRRTRRELFGFPLPNIGLLKDSEGTTDTMDMLQTTITSARYLKSGDIRFTTAEGALWEIIKPPRRLAPISPGDTVEFKKATMGTYFVRIKGQTGVRGKRVQ